MIYGLIATLQFDVWNPIYDDYPDLAPEYESLEPPTIDSELSWDEARLLPDVSEKDLDDILFPLLRSYWKKVLLILFEARDSCNINASRSTIRFLPHGFAGCPTMTRSRGVGDLRRWGYSEVRLKD